jgi:hypothetical protein
MRRPAGWRAWRSAAAAGVLLVGLTAAPAGAHPRLVLSGGRTFAIVANSDEGGPSIDLRALWPLRSDIGLGAALFAHDMGQAVGELPQDMGAVGLPAEFTVSASVAADVHPFASRSGPMRGLFANGTAGPYLVRETQFGNQLSSQGALGWSLGGGWRTRVGDRATAGAFVQYHRVFADRLGRFMSAGLEWSWR